MRGRITIESSAYPRTLAVKSWRMVLVAVRFSYRRGGRGSNLSAGQRQLLSFARALAYVPGILVIDEATSSVDSETERLIQLALVHLLEGRTAVVVAHRLSTIEKADRIMVLSHGELR